MNINKSIEWSLKEEFAKTISTTIHQPQELEIKQVSTKVYDVFNCFILVFIQNSLALLPRYINVQITPQSLETCSV